MKLIMFPEISHEKQQKLDPIASRSRSHMVSMVVAFRMSSSLKKRRGTADAVAIELVVEYAIYNDLYG